MFASHGGRCLGPGQRLVAHSVFQKWLDIFPKKPDFFLNAGGHVILKMFFFLQNIPLHTAALTPTYIHQHTQHNTTQHRNTTQHTTTHNTQCSSDTLSHDRQHHDLQQDQAHFIQSGARSAQVHLDDLLDVVRFGKQGTCQGPYALWPLLLCVKVALRRVGVVVLCCVHGYVVFVALVVVDGVMGAASVFMGFLMAWWMRQWCYWASHETTTAPKPATHPSRLTKTCYTPIRAHKNHGHTHRRTATAPLILPALMVHSGC